VRPAIRNDADCICLIIGKSGGRTRLSDPRDFQILDRVRVRFVDCWWFDFPSLVVQIRSSGMLSGLEKDECSLIQ
jgi:hypothetical protein